MGDPGMARTARGAVSREAPGGPVLARDLCELCAPLGQLGALARGTRAHVGGVAARLRRLTGLAANGDRGGGRGLGAEHGDFPVSFRLELLSEPFIRRVHVWCSGAV